MGSLEFEAISAISRRLQTTEETAQRLVGSGGAVPKAVADAVDKLPPVLEQAGEAGQVVANKIPAIRRRMLGDLAASASEIIAGLGAYREQLDDLIDHDPDGAPAGEQAPSATIPAADPVGSRLPAKGPPPEIAVFDSMTVVHETQAWNVGDEFYDVRSGHVVVGDGGLPRARMGIMAYRKHRPEGTSPPPLAVVFNGGPSFGSNTWNRQIFGGPLMVEHRPDGHLPDEPRLVPNPDSIVAHADTLHIDPVGTSLSAMLPGEREDRYYGVNEDNAALAAVVRWHVERYGAQDVVLVGSSYAAFRVHGVAMELRRAGVPVKGLVDISGRFDFRHAPGLGDPALVAAATLPVLALTSHHYGRLPERWQSIDPFELHREVAEFSWGTYYPAMRGELAMSRAALTGTIRQFTGLSREAVVTMPGLRVDKAAYRADLLGDGRLVSNVDTRLHFHDHPANVVVDPALDRWQPHYQRLLRAHARDLGLPEEFTRDLRDAVLSDWRYNGIWSHKRVTEATVELLREQPMPVLTVNGLYDANVTASESPLFWRDVQARTDQRVVEVDRADLGRTRYEPGVTHMTLLRTGHQLTGDVEARRDFGAAFGAFVRSIIGDRPSPRR